MSGEQVDSVGVPEDGAQDASVFDLLLEQARACLPYSYSPYSHFAVSAAATTTTGRVVSGVNVENASYGLTLCAECSLVSHLHSTGGGKLILVVVVGPDGEPVAPCGRCRQLLLEHAAPGALLLTPDGPSPVVSLLPGAFTPENLDDASTS